MWTLIIGAAAGFVLGAILATKSEGFRAMVNDTVNWARSKLPQ